MKNPVAAEILSQLGGSKFIAMTGANSLCSGKDTLTFRIPNAKNGIKSVVITLDPSDTYTVKFYKPGYFRKGEWVAEKWVAEHSDVYCDQLREIFETETGLLTSL
jgi:hypothetical protein